MQFVIFHGAYGSPEGNWFPQLRKQLEDVGQDVLAPQFPVEAWADVVGHGEGYHSDIQTLDTWLTAFGKDVLPKLNMDDKLCFIGHSLGPVFILHAVEKFNLQLDSAIFVSPFLGPLEQWEFNAVNDTFYKQEFDFDKLKKLIPTSYVVFSDNDPYVPQNQPREFADKVGSAIIVVHDGSHLNRNDQLDLSNFPLIFDLCVTRIGLKPYLQQQTQAPKA